MAERESRRGAAGVDRPAMWEDFTKKQQGSISEGLRPLGNVRSNLPQAIADIDTRLATSSMKKEGRDKYELSKRNMEDMLADPAIKDKPITLKGATKSRIELLTQAKNNARMRSSITGQRELPRGAGWYSTHQEEQSVITNGEMDKSLAAAVGGVMSAGKSPDDEQTGIRGLHRLMNPRGDHSITVHDPSVAAKIGIPVGIHSVMRLTPEQISSAAAHASSENAQSLPASSRSVTSTDHEALVWTGRPHQQNVVKALRIMQHPDVISGKQSPITVGYNPASTPKTWSYATSTAEAPEVGSVDHQDYLNLAHHWAHGDPNQGMMLFGRGSEDEPLHPSLRPDADTAEDTWQQGVGTGQLGSTINRLGQRGSVGKRIVTDVGGVANTERLTKGSLGIIGTHADIKEVAARHAFDNKATRDASVALGHLTHDQFGNAIYMPARMVQEIGWTQMRSNNNADAPFNAEQRTWDKAVRADKKAKKAEGKLKDMAAKGIHLEGRTSNNKNWDKETESWKVDETAPPPATGKGGKPLPPKKFKQGELF